jgi:hypothetical protein
MMQSVAQQNPYAFAAQCVGRLWTLVVANNGPKPSAVVPVVVRRVFSGEQLNAFNLPIDGDRGATQGVALATEAGLTRPETDALLHQEYVSIPRTRVYESLGSNSDGWFSIAQLMLARLARCAVVVTVYQSSKSDETLGRHIDLWYGVIVQVRGSKTWYMEPPDGEAVQITLNPGDVLLMPQGVWHDVTTPSESVHLLFALDTNRPLSSLAG